MLNLYKVIDIPANQLAGVFDEESNLVGLSFEDRQLMANVYDTEKSTWPEPTWVKNPIESNLRNFNGTVFDTDKHLDLMFTMVYHDGTYLYASYVPDYGGNYDPKTPYRLYYAHDTDKLYQNVMDEWIYVATKDHTNLLNCGELTHEELENKIQQLEQNSANVEFSIKEW